MGSHFPWVSLMNAPAANKLSEQIISRFNCSRTTATHQHTSSWQHYFHRLCFLVLASGLVELTGGLPEPMSLY